MRGLIATAAVAALALASVASASTPNTSILIRHQVRGCHAWAVNGSAFKAAQSVKLAHGTVAVVTNNDVMPHRLVQVSGPSAKLSTPGMNHMGAKARIVFAKAGVYKFKTVAGEDYPGMDGMKTIGEDNVLRLTVTVS
jgi:plastocyanin